MEVKRSQLQNLIIYIGDVFGITVGYFLMSHIRFYSDIKYATVAINTAVIKFVLKFAQNSFQNFLLKKF